MFKEGKRYFYDGHGNFAFIRPIGPFAKERVPIYLDKSVVLEYKGGKMWKGDIYFPIEGFDDPEKFVEYLSESEKRRIKDLENEYAGFALQGILSNRELVKAIDGNTYKRVAALSKRFAHETAKLMMSDNQ